MSNKYNHIIVTGFLDIGRSEWGNFKRTSEKYKENAKRLLSTPEPMIIFVESNMINFVIENRDKSYITYIEPIMYNDLYYTKYENKIKYILESTDFRQNAINKDTPEMLYPEYLIVLWSKLFFIERAMKRLAEYDNFAWVDWGIHPHILREINKPLYPEGIKEKIGIHCLCKAENIDLNFKNFMKSGIVRFAGGSITGNRNNLKLLKLIFDSEIKICMNEEAVSTDQSIFTLIYLKYPELFNISYGNWEDIFTNYYKVTTNKNYVLSKFGNNVIKYPGKKIVLVVPAGSYNIGNEFIAFGLKNIIKSLNLEATIYTFEAERAKNVFLSEELDFINSCDLLIYGGGSIIGEFCYNTYVYTLRNVTIPKLLIGAGLSYYDQTDYSNILNKFYSIFDHIITRDDVTYNKILENGYNKDKVTNGIDLAFFTGDDLVLPPLKFDYSIDNVESNSKCMPCTYKIENTYDSPNHVWCGKNPYLSHGYWESLYSIYSNSSFVETSRVHTLVACLTQGVEVKYNNIDSNTPNRHSLFKKIGLDITTKNYAYKNEYIDNIKLLKKEFTSILLTKIISLL